MTREIQLSDLITVKKKDLSALIIKREQNGIKLLTTDQQDVWEIIGCGREYRYRSATWAEKRFERMVKIYEKKV